jgi:phosphoribosylamine--glycine ligase
MMLEDRAFGDAGSEILVEEFMQGEELSLFVLTDGENAMPMLAAQDHKRLLDGDVGPNTGGMGAYAPVSLATTEVLGQAMDRIIEPTLRALRDEGRPFTGLLYAGLMLTESGPKVVEFNCRFGDPETEAILPLMESSLLEPVLAISRGESLAGMPAIKWSGNSSVTTVLASEGYPNSSRKVMRSTSRLLRTEYRSFTRQPRASVNRRCSSRTVAACSRLRRLRIQSRKQPPCRAITRSACHSTANNFAVTLPGGS